LDPRERQIREEIRFYLEERTRELEAEGMSPDEARRVALDAFGDPEKVVAEVSRTDDETTWEERRRGMYERTGRNVRVAVRGMGKRPGFAAVVIATVALGIGGVTAVFSVVNASLIRSLPFEDAEGLVFVQGAFDAPEGPQVRGASPPEARDWEVLGRSFEEVAAVASASFTLTGLGDAEIVAGETVEEGYFELLRVRPLVGRTFTAEEHRAGTGARVALIGEGLWERRFARDPAAAGRTVALDGVTYSVAGVLPGAFQGVNLGAEIWVPLAATLSPEGMEDRGSRWLGAVARLRPGVTRDAAQADMDRVAGQLAAEHPDHNTDRIALVSPLREVYLGNTRTLMLVILGASALLLVIAAVNITNLLLVRGAARAPDVVVQRALGASRGVVASEILTESLVLAVAGSALGLALGVAGARALAAAMPPALLPPFVDVRPDLLVYAAVAALMLLTGLATGLIPALLGGRAELAGRLRERTAGGVRGRTRLQGVLVAGEVGLALLLLIGAGLMGRSLVAQLAVDPGFDAERLLVFRVDLPPQDFQQAAERRAAVSQIVELFRGSPAVTAVSFSSDAPLRGRASAALLQIDGSGSEDRIRYYRHFVGSGYFDAMGIQVRPRGGLDAFDADAPGDVAVISRAMAERLFGGTDPVGRTLRVGAQAAVTVVGVADDVRHRDLTTDLVAGPTDPDVYLPWARAPGTSVEVVLRTEGDPASLAGWVPDILRGYDRDLPAVHVQPMRDVLRAQTAQGRFGSLLLSAFSALAASLAAIGLYGVLAFAVARRGREIAVRMAVGADSARIRRMVVVDGLRVAVFGVGLGVACALYSSRSLDAFLFGVEPVDAPTYALLAVAMAALAALSAWIPAVRATRVDPQRALSSE
jgi:putative ABC transport system permease protein